MTTDEKIDKLVGKVGELATAVQSLKRRFDEVAAPAKELEATRAELALVRASLAELEPRYAGLLSIVTSHRELLEEEMGEAIDLPKYRYGNLG